MAGARGTFGAPALVNELNSADSDARPSVREDGLEIFFYSNRPGVGLNDLWTSTRRRVTDAWSAPVNVGAPVNEVTPPGNTDLWVTTRTEIDGKQEPQGCETK